MSALHKIVFSTILGNIFEYYDFLLFGLAINFMSAAFLPPFVENKTLWLFFIFATGLLIRPLGAYILGKIGDKRGRRISIMCSIFFLAISTFLIGCLPEYRVIGSLSIILLIFLRLIQGFSVSIEQIGGTLFLIENFSEKHHYLACSLIFGSVYLGAGLGLLIWLGMSTLLSHEDFINWGWRVPFLLSLPFGLIGGYLRYHMGESREYLIYNKKYSNLNYEINVKEVVSVVMLFASLAVNSYMTIIYLPNIVYQAQTNINHVWIFNMIGYAVVFLLSVFCGYLADKGVIKANDVLVSSLKYNILLAPIIYVGVSSHFFILSVTANFLALLLLAIQASTTLVLNLKNYNFTTRFSVINIGFTISMTVFGGFASFIAEYLRINIHEFAPALYVIVGTLITYCFLRFRINKEDVIYAHT